ncbi:MAG TPA: hypothetical protein DCY79_07510 [Planctomycetaceae bacterium]|nr:hypothetical protein [Blastopirellula sp.]HAY79637.1 hypothetical protein [Planctomycetaceae bacterium]
MPESTETFYQDRIRHLAAAEQPLHERDRLLSPARAATFVLAVAVAVVGFTTISETTLYAALCLIAALPFLALCIYHETILVQLRQVRERKRINEMLLARNQRRWEDLPPLTTTVSPEHEAVAEDLDLFGRASVFQLLCRANTPRGLEILSDWLLTPAEPDEIQLRQAAVRELIPAWELREELDLRGRLLQATQRGPEDFVAWCEQPASLEKRPWLIWLPRLSTLCGICFAVGWILGLPANIAGCGFVGVILFHAALSILYAGGIHDIFNTVSSTSGQVRHYCTLFQLLSGLQFTSEKLQTARRDMANQEHDALRALHGLQKIMVMPNIRHSAMTFILLYIPLQLLLAWDFHCLWLVEGWHRRHRQFVRHWFEALGEFEALASLASLAHDHPSWTFPEVDPQLEQVAAVQLGHPLLTQDTCVRNDVTVGPPGSFLLVTGSNMSGKSTLLRSLGINVVLAQMGSVTCSDALHMPPLAVATSIHVQDSLRDGVSFYMAELRRLKQIVDQAAAYEHNDERRLFFLLDEILQGTNSRERHIAVERVLSYLVAHGAIGAATTHDLDLATSEALRQTCVPVHFRETLHDTAEQQMTFDYQMRDGVATTTNALKLLELVGLPSAIEP